MADQGVSEGKAEGKKGGWGNEEKYTFALAIIKQLSENGTKGPKLTLIDIPGRTAKALSHQWQAMRKDLISLPVGEAGGSDNTATKPATAKAGKRKIKAGEEDNDTEEPSKKKRGPAKKGTSAKKVAAAKDNQESEETEVDTEHERGVKTEMKASVKKSGANKKTTSSASDGEGEKEKIPAKGRGKKKAATPNSEGDVEGEEKEKKKTAPKRKPSAAAKKGVKKTKAEETSEEVAESAELKSNPEASHEDEPDTFPNLEA